MKIVLVIDETSFYHPEMVAELLRKTSDEVTGAAVITRIPAKNNIGNYLIRNQGFLTMAEKLKLASRAIYARTMDLFPTRNRNGRFFSVQSALRAFGIPFIRVENSINAPAYLDFIRSCQPDVIVSSNSLIFGETLLRIPTIACINRHSGLLPSYGGLWPVFQAFRHGEKTAGVSVHTMEKKIDKGILLSQTEVKIGPGDSVADVYEKCFGASADAILAAIEKLRKGIPEPIVNHQEHSYFSFPSAADWKAFRERGGRFI